MYVVIEMKKIGDKITCSPTSYNTKEDADSAFYAILASAAVSNVDIHSAVILTEDGLINKSQSYKHKKEE